MEKELRDAGFENIHRFSAVDGATLQDATGSVSVSDLVSMRAQVDLIEPHHNHESLPSTGAIGCSLSHMLLWLQLLEGKGNVERAGAEMMDGVDVDVDVDALDGVEGVDAGAVGAVKCGGAVGAVGRDVGYVDAGLDVGDAVDLFAIFEDDCVFPARASDTSPSFQDTLQDSVRKIRQIREFDVLLVGYTSLMCLTTDFDSRTPDVWQMHGRFFGTHAYVITRRGAQRLLRNALPLEVQLDAYIAFRAKLDPAFVLLGYNRSKVRQRLGVTDIQAYKCEGCWAERARHVNKDQLAALIQSRKPKTAFRLHTLSLIIGVALTLVAVIILAVAFIVAFARCQSRQKN